MDYLAVSWVLLPRTATVGDAMGEKARERAEKITVLITALISGQTVKAPALFEYIQNNEIGMLMFVGYNFGLDPACEEFQKGNSRLRYYASEQLKGLADDLAQRCCVSLAALKGKLVDEHLAKSPAACDRQFKTLEKEASAAAEINPRLILLTKKIPFIIAWYNSFRKRVEDLLQIDSREKLAARRELLGKELECGLEINENYFNLDFDADALALDPSFKKGCTLAHTIQETLKAFIKGKDRAHRKFNEQISAWITEMICCSPQDSFKYFMGLHCTLTLLSVQPYLHDGDESGRIRAVRERYAQWCTFAQTVTRAKTLDQLFYYSITTLSPLLSDCRIAG